MPDCSVDGCRHKRKSRGWCQTHYHRWWRTGTVSDPPSRTDWGATVTYRSAHTRVTQAFGKASDYSCASCGAQAHEWSYDGSDPTEIITEVLVKGRLYPITYSRFPEFYSPHCRHCHRLLDWGRRTKRVTCINGHELTQENIYHPPAGAGRHRECRTCRRDSSRSRMRARNAAFRAAGLTARGTPRLYDPPAPKVFTS